MPAYSEMTEVAIWLQCDAEAEVKIEFNKRDSDSPVRQVIASSSSENYFILHFILSDLEMGSIYDYTVFVDGRRQFEETPLSFQTQSLWQHRTDAPNFTLALGSCAYVNEEGFDRPGTPYGSNYKIFDQIAAKSPYAMLWLGDNTYLREPDWNTRSGIYHRNTHTRSLPELQNLLRSCHHYAIWDDHDFGPNDSNGSFINKEWTLEAFNDFWPRPSAPFDGLNGTTAQARLFDVQLFMLDNRYNRTDPDLATVEERILGKAQIDWFIQAMKTSSAKFKLVMLGGQFLSDYAAYENYARYENERQEIIDRIDAEGIEGVVFLTGDRHHTELSSIKLNDGREILDLTCSPLTSGFYDHSSEPNNNRVKGTYAEGHNFGLLHFEGSNDKRSLRIEIFDNSGNQKWEKSYSLSALSAK